MARKLNPRDFANYTFTYEWSCHVALFVLLPGFFVYQTMLALGVIPAFVGGYFSAACIAVLPFVLMFYVCGLIGSGKIQVLDIVYFLFLIYITVTALAHHSQGAASYLLEWHLISVVQMLCVYIVFRGVLPGLGNHARWYIITTVLLSAVVFTLSSEGAFNPRGLSDDHTGLVSYQGFALVLFLLSCLSIGSTPARWLRIVLYIVFAAALYLNGARSEFAGFIVFSILFEFFISRHRILAFVFILGFAAIVTMMLIFGVVELPSNRVANLVNLEVDNSARVRDELSLSGFSKIMDSPLFGDYGAYEQGFYIHNILSAWMDLGFAGFFLFLSLTCIPPALLFWKIINSAKVDARACMVLAMLCACLILLVFGKYFTYLVSPACLGLYSSLSNAKYYIDRGKRLS